METMNYMSVASGAGGVGQYQANTNAPTAIAPIQEAMMRQEHAVGSLHKTITQLENRLACVCAPSPASGQAGTEAPPTPSHHQRLVSLASAIEMADQRLNMLLSELQL